MSPLRRAALLAALAVATGVLAPAANPSPEQAKANVICDAAGVVGGAAGFGNPVADACEVVSDPLLGVAAKALDPLKDAAANIGKGIFNQITAWVADGAVWLLGEIAVAVDETTTPNLLSKGFLHQYRLMVEIAASMAALMLVFAVLEALARGDAGVLWRVFMVNVPLAAIATSAAYVVVQLLLATDDAMCEAISQSTGKDAHQFLKGAVEALIVVGGGSGAAVGAAAGGATGAAAGAVGVPLFIGFIAAVITAFAALFVWIELLMRDAAVYVVALFMPLAIAASIWPRWSSALRKTCELLIVVIFSKFVIVAIISLAASLLARSEGSVEQVLAAAAMLLLARFAPFVLFRLVPFAETAVAAAYSRQSAAGGGVRAVELANSVMLVQRLSRANWAAAGGGGKGGAEGEGGGGGKAAKGPRGGGGGGAEGGEAAAGSGAGAGGAAAAGAVPLAAAGGAAKAAKAGGERLGATGEAQLATGQSGSAGGSQRSEARSGEAGRSHAVPRDGEGVAPARKGEGVARQPAPGKQETSGATQTRPQPAEPNEASGGGSAKAGSRPPRPSGGPGAAGTKGGGS